MRNICQAIKIYSGNPDFCPIPLSGLPESPALRFLLELPGGRGNLKERGFMVFEKVKTKEIKDIRDRLKTELGDKDIPFQRKEEAKNR